VTPEAEEDLRVIARIAMLRECAGEPDAFPRWLSDLVALGPVSSDAHDRVMRAGLIVWSDGWRLTEAGWKALETAKLTALTT
jgi:hypothetical protein